MAELTPENSPRKRSDDIVSLDSWNEAISSPEGESPVEKFFPNKTELKQKAKGSDVQAEKVGSRIKPKCDKANKTQPFILNPSNLMCTPVNQSIRTVDDTANSGHHHGRLEKSVLLKSSEFTPSSHSYKQTGINLCEQESTSHVCDRTQNPEIDKHLPRSQSGSPSRRADCHKCTDSKNYNECSKPSYVTSNVRRQKRSHHSHHHHHHHHRHHSPQPHSQNYSQLRPQKILERLTQHGQIGASSYPPPSSRLASHNPDASGINLEDDVDQSEKVKNKLKSAWNNVIYGWTLKMKTTFKMDSPIFLLGKCFHIRPNDDEVIPGERRNHLPSVEKFKQDFASQLWFTYRQDFPQIPGTKLTSDCGWGCMIRSGQMMLAQAFVTHFLGKDWNVLREQSTKEETLRRQIIRWFGDFPSDNSPFSIHRLVEIGKLLGKTSGEWYGPSSVAHIMRDAMNKAYESQPILEDLCVYVAQDCAIYKEDILDLCCARSRSVTKLGSSTESESDSKKSSDNTSKAASDRGEWKRAVIILVPVRLGGEELNPVYIPCIKSLLAQDNCIGIMGGKPKHSLYFVGFQEDKLIYLDPHYCQDAVDTRERNFPVQSYHCLSPRKVAVSKIDPSCTIGFYCKTRADFEVFISQSQAMVSPPKQKMAYPMFVFSEGKGSDIHFDSLEEEKLLRIRHVKLDDKGRVRSSTLESEEFVVL